MSATKIIKVNGGEAFIEIGEDYIRIGVGDKTFLKLYDGVNLKLPDGFNIREMQKKYHINFYSIGKVSQTGLLRGY